MKPTPDTIIESALQACLNEGGDTSVYNNGLRSIVYNEMIDEFSFLQISSSYKDLKGLSRLPTWYDFQRPNAAKYLIMNYDLLENGEKMKAIWEIHDEDRAEAAVRILKKIHGIKDPWDDDPDWFKTHKPGDEL